MAVNEVFRRTVRAIALGDAVAAAELDSQIPDSDRADYFTFLFAVAAGAIDHYFENDHSRDTIVRFVNELRHEFRKADPPIKPLAIEALIRAVFGEDHLSDDVSSADQALACYPIIRSITHRSEHMQDNVDKYLDDAELLAREWTEDARS